MDTNETPSAHPDPEPAGPPQDGSESAASAAAPERGQPRPAGDGFFTWLRGLGISRPDDRWLGGVAAAIANRAGIDPIIVRGIFIALAIVSGPGILLYAIGWFLLPDTRGRIEGERLIRGDGSGTSFTIAVVIGIFVVTIFFGGIGGFFNGGVAQWGLWGNFGIPEWIIVLFSVLWWVALAGAIVWVALLLIARRGLKLSPEDAAKRSAEWSARTAEQAANWGARVGESAGTWGAEAGAKAGAWGAETGAKAGTWGAQAGEGAHLAAAHVADWTERDREERRRTALDPAHTIFTLGAALLAGGGAALLATTTNTSPLLAGVLAALAVLGLSLIVAGLRGRRSGWVGFWSFCTAVVMLWVAFVPAQTDFRPFGDFDARVTSVEANTESGIGLLAGNANVDLSDLEETGGTLDVWVVAGNARLQLPAQNVPVRVEAYTLAGQQITVAQDGERFTVAGPLLSQRTGTSTRESDRDAVATVRVWVLAGNIFVNGASNSPLSLEDSR